MFHRFFAVLVLVFLVGGPARAADHVLAVTGFDTHSVRPELSPLGGGVADMLTTDLVRGEGIRVVERMRLTEVLDELELQQTDAFDKGTVQEIGRMLGATGIVVGSITVAIEGLRLDARVLDADTGEVIATAMAVGDEADFFALEQALAQDLLVALGVSVPVRADARTPLGLEEILEGAKRIQAADTARLERLEALQAYTRRRLLRVPLSLVQGADGTVNTTMTWTITDGMGMQFTGPRFAEALADAERLTAFEEEIERSKRQGIILGIASVAIVGSGIGMLVANPENSGVDDTLDTLGIVSISVFAAGVMLPWVMPASQRGRQSWVWRYWTPEEADAAVEEHNEVLAEELGVDPIERKRLDLTTDLTD